MSNPAQETQRGAISPKGQEAEARIRQISGQMTLENIHDGSDRSLEYSRLAVQVLDEYLAAMDFLLASPLMRVEDREKMEKLRGNFAVGRIKAQRAVDINQEKSSQRPSQE